MGFFGLFLNPKIIYNKKFNILNSLKIFVYRIFFNNLMNIKTLNKIFIVNPLCLKYMSKKIVSKIQLLNDIGNFLYKNKIIFKKNHCKKILNINKSSFVILVYGRIREDKELVYLINVVKKFKKLHLPYVVKSPTVKFDESDTPKTKVCKSDGKVGNDVSLKVAAALELFELLTEFIY